MKNKKTPNISDINIFKKLLSNNDRDIILNMFEKVQTKYSRKAGQAETDGKEDRIIFYNHGVVDGINHCIKMILGIEDDYLDGIE